MKTSFKFTKIKCHYSNRRSYLCCFATVVNCLYAGVDIVCKKESKPFYTVIDLLTLKPYFIMK